MEIIYCDKNYLKRILNLRKAIGVLDYEESENPDFGKTDFNHAISVLEAEMDKQLETLAECHSYEIPDKEYCPLMEKIKGLGAADKSRSTERG